MFDLKLLFYCFFYTNFKAPNDILDDKTKAFIKTYKSNTAVLDTITKKVVEEYCKQDVPEINKLLRNNITPNGKNRTILEKLDYLTSKSIDRNIIVFRKINFDPFQNAKEHIEKGFMSTSIIDGDINKIHKGRYKLIILLPSSCRGFYVDEISKRCGEYELLLCRNTHLKEIARKKQKGIIFILCKANV